MQFKHECPFLNNYSRAVVLLALVNAHFAIAVPALAGFFSTIKRFIDQQLYTLVRGLIHPRNILSS